MVNKKSQSAMEYLMTYGWAILVVLIALGALFYLGVFNPKQANSCVAGAPITCTDVKAVNDGTTTLVLGTTGTSVATLTNIALTTPAAQNCNPVAGTISTSSPTGIACDTGANIAVGSKFAGTGTVTYTLQGSTTAHTATIQISGTVEA